MAMIDADDAAIETAQTQLDYTTITAPSDGRIGVRLVDPGNVVRASDAGPIATLVLAQPAAVMFTLPSRALDDIRQATDRGQIEVIAFDQDNRLPLSTGKLLMIDNAVDQTTATIRLKAIFPNADDKLWPGEFVNARLLLETRSNAIVVPSTAVQRGPQGLFTWVVTANNIAVVRPIQVGPTSGDFDHHRFRGQRGRTRGHRRTVQVADQFAGLGDVSARGERRTEHHVNISEPFIRRPIATCLMMSALAFVGIAAFPFLPVAPLPQVDFPTIQVTTALAGASAETMASAVATPLERQFGQIASITQMTSTSTLGATTIVLQFDLNRNIDAAAQDVQAAITAAGRQLPQALTTPPVYRKTNPADIAIMIFGMHSDTLPLTTIDDYADNFLVQQLSQVPGVAQVFIGGESKPAVHVQVDPARLAAIGLTLEEIRGAIVASTTNAAKGTLNTPDNSFTIASNDQLTLPEQYDNVVLAYRNGAPIRVRDIGQSVLAAADRTVAAYTNQLQGLLLLVTKQPGANVIETVDKIKAQLPGLMAKLPPAMQIETILDRTQTIRASVHDVEFTLGITIALVVMVILLFLRNFWATFIPAVTVPLALLGSCAAMYLLNFSLDNLSLMALTIAVGFVVDDAIVVVENIYRHVEHGMPPLEAAIKGSREIGFTVLSISCSLIAVFIPLLLMGGIIGRLFREFALTVTASIAVSALVSLTLAPMLCSRFLHAESGQHGRFFNIVEEGFNRLIGGYRRTLDVVLRHQAITLGVFFATMALTVVMIVESPKGFFPIQDIGVITGFSEAAQSASPDQMMRLMQEQNEIVLQDPDVLAIGSITGSTGGFANTANTGRAFIALKPRDQRKSTASQVIDRLRPQARQDRRRQSVPAAHAGHHRRRPAGARKLPVHVAGFQHRRIERVVGQDAGEAQDAAAADRRIERSPGQRAAAHDRGQPRPGRALRHLAANHRRHAQRRLWATSDHPVFHPAQHLLGDRGDFAGAAKDHRFACPHLREIAA